MNTCLNHRYNQSERISVFNEDVGKLPVFRDITPADNAMDVDRIDELIRHTRQHELGGPNYMENLDRRDKHKSEAGLI